MDFQTIKAATSGESEEVPQLEYRRPIADQNNAGLKMFEVWKRPLPQCQQTDKDRKILVHWASGLATRQTGGYQLKFTCSEYPSQQVASMPFRVTR